MRTPAALALSLVALAACALTVGLLRRQLHRQRAEPADGQRRRRLRRRRPPTPARSPSPRAASPATSMKSGTYYVYANVADSGNPASGIASVKANVSAITSGQTAVSARRRLLHGRRRHLQLPQRSADRSQQSQRRLQVLLARPRRHSRQLAHARASPSPSTTGPSPAATSKPTTSPAAPKAKPEKGDTVSFVFNKAPDPNSIVSGWNGSGAEIGHRLDHRQLLQTTFSASAAPRSAASACRATSRTRQNDDLHRLEPVPERLDRDDRSRHRLGRNAKSETTKSKPVWTPSASNYDVAGNACSTTTVSGENESSSERLQRGSRGRRGGRRGGPRGADDLRQDRLDRAVAVGGERLVGGAEGQQRLELADVGKARAISPSAWAVERGGRLEPARVGGLDPVRLRRRVGRRQGEEEPGVEAARDDLGGDPAREQHQLLVLRQGDPGLLLQLPHRAGAVAGFALAVARDRPRRRERPRRRA